MDLPTDVANNGPGTARILSSQNVQTGGSARITALSSTSISVRLTVSSQNLNMDQAFRVGFRFYTPRLLPGTCSSVTVWTNRWGWTPFSGNAANTGVISPVCGTGGSGSRKFYVVLRMFYKSGSSSWPRQWPDFYSGDYFDFNLNFNTIGGDVSFPNSLWVSASWVW